MKEKGLKYVATRIVLFLLLMISILCFDFRDVFASGNYGVDVSSSCYHSANPFRSYEGECTWYAWGRALEKCGVELECRGNASAWLSYADSSPSSNSIAVWDAGGLNESYGHVAFVEKYENGIIYISEYNRQGADSQGNPRAAHLYSEGTVNLSNGLFSFTYGDSKSYTLGVPDGYIHLEDPDPDEDWGDSKCPTKNVVSGVYVIHSAWDDNYCLDIYENSKANNANIQLYQRVSGSNVQKFRIIRMGEYCYIKSIHSGNYLDLAWRNGKIRKWSNAKLYDIGSNYGDLEKTADQLWKFEDAGNGYVYIRNKCGAYLDVQGDRAENNRNIQAYPFVGNKSQKWRLEDVTDYVNVEDGTYYVHSAWDDNYYLDISGDSKENRAKIQLFPNTRSIVQRFKFKTTGNYYTVQSLYSGKYLDIKTPIECRSDVQQWESCSSAEQHWRLENAGNGYVYLRSDADYYLDVRGDKAVKGANIQMYSFVGNNSQRWRLERYYPDSAKPKTDKTSYNINSDVSVKWSAVPEATSYFINVYTWTDSYANRRSYLSKSIGNVTSYTLPKLKAGNYRVYIEAINAGGTSKATYCEFKVVENTKPSPKPTVDTTPTPTPGTDPTPTLSQDPAPTPSQDQTSIPDQDPTPTPSSDPTQQLVVSTTPKMELNDTKLVVQAKKSSSAIKALLENDSIAGVTIDKPGVATVSFSGDTINVSAGKKKGKATVTVTSETGIERTFSLEVQTSKVVPKKLTIPKESKKITLSGKGETASFVATATPDNISTGASFSIKSSNTNVATAVIDPETGETTITAVGNGTANVTVSVGKKKQTSKVTVKGPVFVTGVKLNKGSKTIKVNKTLSLKATLTPKKPDNKNVTWSSTNPEVVDFIKKKGLSATVKGKGKGTAEITVTTTDGGITAKCTVTVK